MKTVMRDCQIEYSEEAAVQMPDGRLFSPFVENSLVARVAFEDDGYIVIVALPPGARLDIRQHSGAWATAVADAARDARDLGLRVSAVEA